MKIAGDREVSLRYQAGWTFVVSGAWVLALLVLSILLLHVIAGPHAALVQTFALLLLAVAGFYWIALRRVSDLRPLSAIGFVRRPGVGREIGVGLAVGWAIAIALVLPALMTRNLHTLLSVDGKHAGQTLYSLLLVVATAVTTQVIASGLVFRSLVRATSPGRAVLSVALVTGISQYLQPGRDSVEALFCAVASTMFALAALRTRAIWLGIGLQVGWGIALTLVFGVGSFYWPTSGGLVTSYITGMRGLTGSNDGPEASWWALAVVGLAAAVLWRVTREYAWHYTFDPIEGAAYAVTVAPPAEHTRMEGQAARKEATLVQIQAGNSSSGTPPPPPTN